ncbi:sodium export permease [[Clostridium] sordellii]|uniref:ABC transporter permease n=1 Tax=Paraclostridium sordellii TaxID=1505 RepID=UPI0005E14481|nr:ABC transporter permease [Paeniclostridium sordellii]CEP43300.1 sodium export permease [[Clostridium] sordellii] [Paeniclostridium sordellii]
MRKIKIIFQQLYLEKVKSKTFIILTSLLIIMLLSIGFLPKLVQNITKQDATIKIINSSSLADSDLIFDKNNDVNNTNITLSITKSSREFLNKEVENKKINGYLIIDDIDENTKGIKGEYYSNNLYSPNINNYLETVITKNNNNSAEKVLGIKDSYSHINTLQVKSINESNQGSNDSQNMAGKVVVIYIFIFLIYMFVMLYASMIATEISKEKDSKMIEVIISTVKPREHFYGKLLAIFMVALTQLSILTVSTILILKYSKSEFIIETVNGIINTIPNNLWIYGLVFFILDFIGYSVICGLLGSLTSKVEEVGQYITPIVLILILTLVLSNIGISSPDLSIIKIASFIPLISPMVMFVRIGLGDVSMVSIMISISLQILFNVIILIYGSWLYKGTVLTDNSNSKLKNKIKNVWLLLKS